MVIKKWDRSEKLWSAEKKVPLENVNSSRVVYAKDEHPPHRHIQAHGTQEMECNWERNEGTQREKESSMKAICELMFWHDDILINRWMVSTCIWKWIDGGKKPFEAVQIRKVSQTWIKWYLPTWLVWCRRHSSRYIHRSTDKLCRLKIQWQLFLLWYENAMHASAHAAGIFHCFPSPNTMQTVLVLPHKSIHTKIKSQLIYWSLLLFRHS